MNSGYKLNNHVLLDVPEGVSCIGSSELDPYASDREYPLREVFVSSFAVSQHPTTRTQFAVFIREVVGGFSDGWGELDANGWPRKLAQYGDYPMVGVSWEAAIEYCAWLSGRSGLSCALPTEAEWEKAARGGDDRVWPWGNEFLPDLCNSIEGSGGAFRSVYELETGASPYGAMHMAGGVWEWCEDFYHAYSRHNAEFIDPVAAMPSSLKVVKGGSAHCTKEIVRPACRDWTNSHNQGGGDDGFRVCMRPWR
jgi:formylglycine-generating enzyme required for sulfatase activity